MPQRDGTGPRGEGPLTGRGLGRCQKGRGVAGGWGRGGGRGRGFGRGLGMGRGLAPRVDPPQSDLQKS